MQTETKVKWRQNPQALSRAEEYVKKLEQSIADPAQADHKAELEAALAMAKKEVETAKQATAEKELTVFVPSNALRVQIQAAPFQTSQVSAVEAKAGQVVKLLLKIGPLFGFDGTINLIDGKSAN